MQKIRSLGTVTWSEEEMKAAIPEFLKLYAAKPLKNNDGGMNAPHMFATWFMLRKLNPSVVIESGVWKGQGTWLIEQTLPQAKIYSIDINLAKREYVSPRVTYYSDDFSTIDWSMISDKKDVVLFFDDHQNELERIKQGAAFGFEHFIFEDNYPAKQGDCYSLKKAFQEAGFRPVYKSLLTKITHLFKKGPAAIEPNKEDAVYLQQALATYYEFPPVFTNDTTRWGDAWTEEDYPTPAPLYTQVEQPHLQLFKKEATDYTWICYARVKK